jgi:nucleoside-diphosphate-sugar epimerase
LRIKKLENILLKIIMKILLTGNQGYIGTVLTQFLRQQKHYVVGYDCGFFENCLLVKDNKPNLQIKEDIRNIKSNHLKNIDCVIHLAALSNDPLGSLKENLTKDINELASIRLAKLAKKNGVKKFIFLSTQSVYGVSKTKIELDEYTGKKAPVTAYAITKLKAEKKILILNDKKFKVVIYRPATVFGFSPRLRSDIVYNNFLASGYTTKKIMIMSDGSPIRPVIHVQDVCKAILLSIKNRKINGKIFNLGVSNNNYTVNQIASAASKVIPGTKIIYTGQHGADTRTYAVSFKRIKNILTNYKPKFNLINGGKELVSNFKKISFSKKDFKGTKTNRL